MTTYISATINEDGTTTVHTAECMVCFKTGELTLDTVAFNRYDLQDEFIQNAFPDMSAGDREQLLSGTHDACWNEIFPKEEDETDSQDEQGV